MSTDIDHVIINARWYVSNSSSAKHLGDGLLLFPKLYSFENSSNTAISWLFIRNIIVCLSVVIGLIWSP